MEQSLSEMITAQINKEEAKSAVNEAEEFLGEMKRFLHENFGRIFK